MSWVVPPVRAGAPIRALDSEEGWRAAAGQILSSHGLSPTGLAPFASGSDVVWGTPGS